MKARRNLPDCDIARCVICRLSERVLDMKKRIFAAIAASVLLCGVLSAPASASGYKKGDVNMDGEITVEDAQLALIEYTEYLVAGKKHTLTDAQLELANVDEKSFTTSEKIGSRTSPVDVIDAWAILFYYTEGLANEAVKNRDIVDFLKENFPNF